MKKVFVVVITFFVLISFNLKSQTSVSLPKYIDDIFSSRGEVYFKFNVNNKAEINQLSQIISVDHFKNNEVYAYANKTEFINFLNYNYFYTILPPPSSLFAPVMSNYANIKSTNLWDAYPTYDAYESMMYQFQSDYPSLCKVYNLGTLSSGRKLLVIKISDNVNVKEYEPRFLYSSSMHGDEITGYVSMLRLIDYLLSNYSSIPAVANLVNNIEIWINPLANPDGTYAGGNNTVASATRNNANNIDLNRNYRNPVSGEYPNGARQPETSITMAFADTMKFTMAANFHGGEECINYPWDSWLSAQKLHADHSWWQLVSHQYADTARFYSPSGYLDPENDIPVDTCFHNGVTHGGDWYVVYGSRQDYTGYYANTREVTVEISNTKLPAASTLPNYWNYNYRSFLNYMQQSLYGLKGIVTDSCNGNPLEAQIFITGHDYDNSQVYSSLPVGNYHRPLLAGTYSVTISAAGYTSKTFNNIVVSNYNTTVLNAALSPLLPQGTISANTNVSCSGEISFTADLQNADSWLWHFGDGTTSNVPNPFHYYNQNDTFFVYISVTNCVGTQQIALDDTIIINKPAAPQVQSVFRCGPGSLTLSASSTGDVFWYDNINATVPVFSGNNFTTPPLSQTTDYFVESTEDLIAYVGDTSSNSSGVFNNSSTKYYLVFDCYKPLTLLSVEVNASDSKNRTFYLRNSASQILDSVVVYIQAGISRVNMNLNIPVGTDLQLVGPSNSNLYRTQSSNLAYPYTIPGYLSIKKCSVTSSPTGYYYFFYDWEVKLDECVSQRTSVTAEILDTPVVDFSFIVNDLSVDFSNLTAGTNTYFWDFNDSSTSTLENPTHVFSSYGTYNVKLKVTNECGTDSLSIPIQLSTDLPQADFIADQLSVQIGSNVQFTDLSTNNPNTWAWVFEGGTPANSSVKNPLVQYNTPGTYYVLLTVTNAFGSDYILKSGYITVTQANLAPSADFTSDVNILNAGDSVHFTDLSLYNPTSWLWNIEGGTPSSSTLQNPVIVYNTPGTYFVSLIATNSFGNDYEMKYDFIQVNPSGINVLSDKTIEISIFPNPCKDEVYFQLPDTRKPLEISIFDIIGNVVQTVPLTHLPYGSKPTVKINVSGLSSGLYYMHCITDEKVYIGKFLK